MIWNKLKISMLEFFRVSKCLFNNLKRSTDKLLALHTLERAFCCNIDEISY